MKRIIKDIIEYKEYVLFSAKSQLKAEVATSKLNWIWWVLEPFCFMLVYSFVFGVLFNSKEEYHALFIFLGLSMWQFFSKTVKGSVQLLRHRKAIISRIYIPKYMLVLQAILVNGFKLGICMVITICMMIFYRVHITWQIIYIIPVVIVLALGTFGFSCFMLHIGVFFTDLSNIMDIVLRMMMYFTGVFYSIATRFPSPFNVIILKWNPVAMLMDAARGILIYGRSVDLKMLFFWAVISCVLSFAGIRVIYNNENSYVKVV